MVSQGQYPLEDRPEHRLFSLGAKSLSDCELLAILIGSTGKRGISAAQKARVLLSASGGLGSLCRLDVHQIARMQGAGRSVAARVSAVMELGIRAGERRRTPRERFRSSRDIHEAYGHRLAHMVQEIFLVVVLDNAHRPVREVCVARGGLNSCSVEPRDVFRPAVHSSGASVLLMHNHPSGDPTPSRDDVEISRRLADAGRVIGISVLDHVIIGSEGYSSLRDLGLLEKKHGTLGFYSRRAG